MVGGLVGCVGTCAARGHTQTACARAVRSCRRVRGAVAAAANRGDAWGRLRLGAGDAGSLGAGVHTQLWGQCADAVALGAALVL